MKTSVLKIDGMGCAGCVNSVETALASLPGVKSVEVRLNDGTAIVNFDEQEVKESEFKKAVDDAGYSMKGIEG